MVLGASSLAALPAMARGGIGVQIDLPAPVVVAPAPVVTVAVPDTYVWDGSEYVGMVGSSYFYLGPGDVWLAMDGPRLARFHDWEHHHADWRDHATRNERYRKDARGHEVPMREMRDDRVAPDNHARDSHDNRGIDQGRDRDHQDHH